MTGWTTFANFFRNVDKQQVAIWQLRNKRTTLLYESPLIIVAPEKMTFRAGLLPISDQRLARPFSPKIAFMAVLINLHVCSFAVANACFALHGRARRAG